MLKLITKQYLKNFIKINLLCYIVILSFYLGYCFHKVVLYNKSNFTEEDAKMAIIDVANRIMVLKNPITNESLSLFLCGFIDSSTTQAKCKERVSKMYKSYTKCINNNNNRDCSDMITRAMKLQEILKGKRKEFDH